MDIHTRYTIIHCSDPPSIQIKFHIHIHTKHNNRLNPPFAFDCWGIYTNNLLCQMCWYHCHQHAFHSASSGSFRCLHHQESDYFLNCIFSHFGHRKKMNASKKSWEWARLYWHGLQQLFAYNGIQALITTIHQVICIYAGFLRWKITSFSTVGYHLDI